MTLHLGHWNTSGTPQIAVIDSEGDSAETVIVLAQDDVDGLTAGQLSVFHGSQKGTEPGTWTD